ncbi:putative secreted protein (Por secretion system target) [Flavobacterium lacus]|uniref:Putative secreted protein (Por secretion system target) n=2 Tax=Flavobacterium lacus TaxID=1353778 RepID=A0A328WM73_9FLAO|nr:putative secreted protein (Por secretion system target) [Flavobacterium lacus]
MKAFFKYLFFLMPCWVFGQIQLYEYWFDNQYENKVIQSVATTNELPLNSMIPTAGLTPGVHSYSIHFKDANNHWSSVLTQFFYKVPDAFTMDSPRINEYEYWFDADYENSVTLQATPQQLFILEENIESVLLTHGIHSFSIRFKDENNDWSSVLTQFFYKLPDAYLITNPKIKEYEYWFDEDYDNRVIQTVELQTLFPLEEAFDTSDLTNTVHTISVRFKDENEEWSSVLTQFFYKQDGQLVTIKEIIEYQYWFNEEATNATSVSVAPSDIYELDTFVIPEDFGLGLGTNSFHLRFKDNSGFWSSVLSADFEINSLDIPSNTLKDVIVYPNPTVGNLQIDLPQFMQEVQLRVYDLNGRLVQQKTVNRVDHTEIQLQEAAGFYILVVESGGLQSVHKILKR